MTLRMILCIHYATRHDQQLWRIKTTSFTLHGVLSLGSTRDVVSKRKALVFLDITGSVEKLVKRV